jgi:hypothetical protein
MVIAKLKVDDRGRLQFPQSFLKGNGITPETEIEVHTMQGKPYFDSVRLIFKGINEEELNLNGK